MARRKHGPVARSSIAVASISLLLAACGGSEEAAAPAPAPAPAEAPTEEADPTEGCAAVTARLAHHVGETDGFHVGAIAFAEAVSEQTDGRVTVELFPNSQIGGYTENPENILQEELEFALVDTSVLANYFPEGSIIDLPFMFETQQEFYDLMDGEFGDYLKAKMADEIGIELLVVTSSGFRNMFFRGDREVVQPSDLKDVVLRVPNAPLYVQIFTLLETVPTVVEAGELYNAVQTGIVEGFEFPLPALVSLSLQEVVDKMSVTQHIHTAPKLGVGSWFMDSLCENDANVIREVAKSVFETTTRAAYEELLAGVGSTIADAGVETITADIPAFRDAVQPIYAEFQAANGTDLWDRLEAAR